MGGVKRSLKEKVSDQELRAAKRSQAPGRPSPQGQGLSPWMDVGSEVEAWEPEPRAEVQTRLRPQLLVRTLHPEP